MPLYEIKTHSVFELINIIEADNEEQAKHLVVDGNADGFLSYQKHLGETVIEIHDVSGYSNYQVEQQIRNRGYF